MESNRSYTELGSSKQLHRPGERPRCTPPAENSKPSGASDGADGQGACIPRYQLAYRDTVALNGQFGADVVETGYSAADALVVLRSLLGLGIPSITVTVLP